MKILFEITAFQSDQLYCFKAVFYYNTASNCSYFLPSNAPVEYTLVYEYSYTLFQIQFIRSRKAGECIRNGKIRRNALSETIILLVYTYPKFNYLKFHPSGMKHRWLNGACSQLSYSCISSALSDKNFLSNNCNC